MADIPLTPGILELNPDRFKALARARAPAHSECAAHRGEIQFGSAWVVRMEQFGLRQPTSPESLHRTKAGWLAGQLYQEFCTEDSASILSIEGFALALLGEIARSGSPAERRGAKPGRLLRAVENVRAGVCADAPDAWRGGTAHQRRSVGETPIPDQNHPHLTTANPVVYWSIARRRPAATPQSLSG